MTPTIGRIVLYFARWKATKPGQFADTPEMWPAIVTRVVDEPTRTIDVQVFPPDGTPYAIHGLSPMPETPAGTSPTTNPPRPGKHWLWPNIHE